MNLKDGKKFLGAVALLMTSAFAQSTFRDAAGVNQLTAALQQEGDRSAWRTLHSVHVRGSVTTRILRDKAWSTENTTLDWVDDWSTGRPRYKRSFGDGTKQHTTRHAGGETFAVRMGKKKLSVHQFDLGSVLLVHLPAFALARILMDEIYSIRALPQLDTTQDTVVQVTNTAGDSTQDWFLSRDTGRVDAVRFSVPDVLKPSHKVWETAIYKHYRTEGGLAFPDQVTVYRPNGQRLDYTFTSFEKNPATTPQDFTSSGAAQ